MLIAILKDYNHQDIVFQTVNFKTFFKYPSLSSSFFQCNILFSAQRYKLQLFTGFRRQVVVVFPSAEEWKKRLSEHQTGDGEQIPETALLKLQGPSFVHVWRLNEMIKPETACTNLGCIRRWAAVNSPTEGTQSLFSVVIKLTPERENNGTETDAWCSTSNLFM